MISLLDLRKDINNIHNVGSAEKVLWAIILELINTRIQIDIGTKLKLEERIYNKS